MSFDPAKVEAILERTGRRADALIAVLHALQEEYQYLPEEALQYLCAHSEMTPAAVESVVSFFPGFRRKPTGEHTISVCDGTACHVKGAAAIYDAVAESLALPPGEDTDAEGRFTLRKVACLGCCTLAPAVQIDEVTYGHVQSDGIDAMLQDFLKNAANPQQRETAPPSESDGTSGEIRIGLGSCCVAGGSEKVRAALQKTLHDLGSTIPVKNVSCVGVCHQTPLLEIILPGKAPALYAKVQAEDVEAIVARHIPAQKKLFAWKRKTARWFEGLYASDSVRKPQDYALDVEGESMAAFLKGQCRLATEYCGEINPLDLDEYIRLGGFSAFESCLNALKSDSDGNGTVHEKIIKEIEASGLRGRGGAGFPVAKKWRVVRAARSERKYVICNGDEGDPGAFMDRMILESYPFRVIEGMLIAALATDGLEGIFYIRAEYPLAVERVTEALKRCREAGYLGDSICDSSFSFQIRVVQGAGAFICGEETALIASVEGRRGTPSLRPPYPAQKGVYGSPTLVNNTETLALVPWIMRHGAEAFSKLGTEKSAGTKVFSLAGKIVRGGLIEVPMGMSVGAIVEDIGGGVADGRKLKAVQIGGPSGGCIPASLAHTPVDYEALTEAGAMMGSGGFVVLDESDCMVEMTQYFLSFTQLESCGKCTPCRVGSKRMLEILDRLCAGEGKAGDIEQLLELADIMKSMSLCGLGKTAPNPVLTALRYFREEFEAHINGKCPAGKCKALIHYYITDDCIGCTKCAQVCPSGAIAMKPYEVHHIDDDLCVRCGECYQICPVDSVKVE
ncbi:MAG: 4Fe-4S binding protein [Candidatus Hydrogenedens sp.]|nr:4Fe-4S binding protein [Candidatus Hydrogenedens sp.]